MTNDSPGEQPQTPRLVTGADDLSPNPAPLDPHRRLADPGFRRQLHEMAGSAPRPAPDATNHTWAADAVITKAESVPDTDYVRYTMSDGTLVDIPRADVLRRGFAVVQAIQRMPPAVAEHEEMDKHIWRAIISLRAALANGKSRGVSYPPKALQEIEAVLADAEKRLAAGEKANKKRPLIVPPPGMVF